MSKELLANMTKAEMIKTYPKLSLKMSMLKDDIIKIIKDSEPKAKVGNGQRGEY